MGTGCQSCAPAKACGGSNGAISCCPKVGRLLKPAWRDSIDFAPWTNAAPFTMQGFDYSYDGTMRSIEDSLQRMALERLDICFIHDIDVFTRGADQPEVFRQAMDGCYKALDSLRSQGVVKAIGVGVNEWEAHTRRCNSAISTVSCWQGATRCWNRMR